MEFLLHFVTFLKIKMVQEIYKLHFSELFEFEFVHLIFFLFSDMLFSISIF